MNIDNGHLIRVSEEQERLLIQQRDLYVRMVGGGPGVLAPRYVPVPRHLRKAAEKELAGRSEAVVDLKGGGELAQFAAEERAKRGKVRRKVKVRSYREFCR